MVDIGNGLHNSPYTNAHDGSTGAPASNVAVRPPGLHLHPALQDAASSSEDHANRGNVNHTQGSARFFYAHQRIHGNAVTSGSNTPLAAGLTTGGDHWEADPVMMDISFHDPENLPEHQQALLTELAKEGKLPAPEAEEYALKTVHLEATIQYLQDTPDYPNSNALWKKARQTARDWKFEKENAPAPDTAVATTHEDDQDPIAVDISTVWPLGDASSSHAAAHVTTAHAAESPANPTGVDHGLLRELANKGTLGFPGHKDYDRQLARLNTVIKYLEDTPAYPNCTPLWKKARQTARDWKVEKEENPPPPSAAPVALRNTGKARETPAIDRNLLTQLSSGRELPYPSPGQYDLTVARLNTIVNYLKENSDNTSQNIGFSGDNNVTLLETAESTLGSWAITKQMEKRSEERAKLSKELDDLPQGARLNMATNSMSTFNMRMELLEEICENDPNPVRQTKALSALEHLESLGGM
jgi:hypothetical protein